MPKKMKNAFQKKETKKKNPINVPEDLHFYYIQFLQEGKKNES